MAPVPYIRFRDPDDLGLRPFDQSPYTTPAITLHKPSGFDPDPAIAFAGVQHSIRVEVGNKGTTAADATVTVWAYAFGTASGYLGTLGGVTGRSAPVTIPAGSSGSTTAVSIDWTPQAAELGGLSERHCCLQANVFVDPADQEPDPGAPAGTPPAIDITNIIRHAQRNMTLLPHPMMFKREMEFMLAIANPDEREEQEFAFEVRPVRGALQRNEITHLRRTRWIDRKFPKELVLVGTHGEVKVVPARREVRHVELELGEGKPAKALKARLKPGEQGEMTLRMAFAPGEEAAVHRFDVVQRGRKGIVGGARVMTLAVPEKLLEDR